MKKYREKRASPRISYVQPVGIQYSNSFWRAATKDISQSGAFIISNTYPKLGSEIVLNINLPGCEHAALGSWVRWVNSLGFGIQFKPMGARETHGINELYKRSKVQEIDDSDIIE